MPCAATITCRPGCVGAVRPARPSARHHRTAARIVQPQRQQRRRRCVNASAQGLEAVSAFISNNAAVLAGIAVLALVVITFTNMFKKGSRKYDGNVGDEYDAWTREGILEHYWGDHIHLGYYSAEERKPGIFPWGKKNFKQVR